VRVAVLVTPGELPNRGSCQPSVSVTPFCVWGVGAQRVRGYGCTSNAPTSHILVRSLGKFVRSIIAHLTQAAGQPRWSVVRSPPISLSYKRR
jgi:hypothetical protein